MHDKTKMKQKDAANTQMCGGILYRITGIKGNMSSAESGASGISYPHIVAIISQY